MLAYVFSAAVHGSCTSARARSHALRCGSTYFNIQTLTRGIRKSRVAAIIILCVTSVQHYHNVLLHGHAYRYNDINMYVYLYIYMMYVYIIKKKKINMCIDFPVGPPLSSSEKITGRGRGEGYDPRVVISVAIAIVDYAAAAALSSIS